jgi:hypothetical protein
MFAFHGFDRSLDQSNWGKTAAKRGQPAAEMGGPMNRSSVFSVALALGVAASIAGAAVAQARTPAVRHFPEGTWVTVVGRISSQPKNGTFVHEHKMQVSVGPHSKDYTLHLRHATIIGPNGHRAQISDMQDRWWVRAEGRVMNDPLRVMVSRMKVFRKGGDSLQGTAYYRPGKPYGYVTAVAGSRQSYPRRR